MRKLATVLFLMILSAAEMLANKITMLRDSENVYTYVLVSSDADTTAKVNFTDEEFYRISTGVEFVVNRSDIRPDSPFIDVYNKRILPLLNQRHLQLKKIFIRGASSPEGPYENNRRLGKARAQALLDVIKKDLRHQYGNVDIDVNSVTEDYAYLCILMREAGDKDYERVQKIVDDANGNERLCKRRLMDDGVLWRRLLSEYFPRLRAARFVLVFDEPDVEHSPLAAVEPRTYTSGLASHISQANLAERTQMPVFEEETPEWERRHLIALRTNFLHDFFYMPGIGFCPSPNLQLEFYPKSGHFTYNLAGTWGTRRLWDNQQFFQVRDFQFEARRYFRGGGEFKGLYLGAYLHGNKYGIGLNGEKGWQGEGAGAGLSVGYVLPLNRKGNLRMEFMLAAGYYFSVFDPYVYGNPLTGDIDGFYYYDYIGEVDAFKQRAHKLSWIGPTNVGIQLTYDIIYRKKTRKQ